MDIRALADSIGYPAAALGILIESTGLPFPGELTLLAVAAYAGTGRLNIVLVIVLAAVGAVAGGDLGYFIGLRGGRPFLERLIRWLRLSPSHLAQAEVFFAHHGDKTILVGRFVLGLRSYASMFAGVARMPFWRFQLYSVIGAVAWATTFGIVGFVLGHNWPLLERVVRGLGYLGVGIVVVGGVSLLLVRRHARRRSPPPRR